MGNLIKFLKSGDRVLISVIFLFYRDNCKQPANKIHSMYCVYYLSYMHVFCILKTYISCIYFLSKIYRATYFFYSLVQ